MSDRYVLDGQTPIVEKDLMKWAEWFEKSDIAVAKYKNGDVSVSTVFLGLNHNYGIGAPILFETMVFGGKFDGEQERYSTWDDAENGHDKMIKLVESD